MLGGLEKRWHKCIISEGDNFEEDNIEIHELINIFRKKMKIHLTQCVPIITELYIKIIQHAAPSIEN